MRVDARGCWQPTHDPQRSAFDRRRVILRKSSIDELPQLLNVLFGSMSLVGPRPHPLNAKANGDFYGKVVANYQARHRVKPGITGLAQVLGWRGPTDTHAQIEQRVANDLRYISAWSFFQTLILVRTAFTLFGKNAQ
jgi:lipopolysaccharide/colanic/teichoic acid biosynthesis glycosyltransferase